MKVIDSAPAICVFFKPRTSGPAFNYLKAMCYNEVDIVLQSNDGASRFREVSREA